MINKDDEHTDDDDKIGFCYHERENTSQQNTFGDTTQTENLRESSSVSESRELKAKISNLQESLKRVETNEQNMKKDFHKVVQHMAILDDYNNKLQQLTVSLDKRCQSLEKEVGQLKNELYRKHW